jgi:hypothetical protein
MNQPLTIVWPLIFLLTLLSLDAGAQDKKSAAKKALPTEYTIRTVNDFPTQARVEYVSQCMAEKGGANLDNMYHCVCAVDKIASYMSYQDYAESLTFTYMFDTPGDKGGEFRDPPKSKILRDKLKYAQKEAESCFPAIPAKAPETKN